MVKVKDCDWSKAPMWKKRLSGSLSYLVAAVVALYDPVGVDRALFEVLSEQFEDDGQ